VYFCPWNDIELGRPVVGGSMTLCSADAILGEKVCAIIMLMVTLGPKISEQKT
jgi:hypothetical protein